jgi:hypothetical protein
MKPNPETTTERELEGATTALRRAAQRARLIARHTHTPLVLGKAGRVEKRWLEGEAAPSIREDFEKYLAAVPDAPPPENDRLD